MKISHETKGVLISVVFLAALVLGGLSGVDLGRFLWILLIFLFVFAGIYLTFWAAVRILRGKRSAK
ncbi:MAG TPA: hypothetical protein VF905_10190 [Nitrospirota bacterium]